MCKRKDSAILWMYFLSLEPVTGHGRQQMEIALCVIYTIYILVRFPFANHPPFMHWCRSDPRIRADDVRSLGKSIFASWPPKSWCQLGMIILPRVQQQLTFKIKHTIIWKNNTSCSETYTALTHFEFNKLTKTVCDKMTLFPVVMAWNGVTGYLAGRGACLCTSG